MYRDYRKLIGKINMGLLNTRRNKVQKSKRNNLGSLSLFIAITVVSLSMVLPANSKTALADDSFDGVMIDTEKWEAAFRDGSSVVQNDALFVSHDGAESAKWDYASGLESFAPAAGVVSKWKLSGDFDIQVDFSQFSAAPVSYGQAFFSIFQDDMNALHIKRIRSSWQDGVQTVYIHGSPVRHSSWVNSFSAPSGTFRIVRSGNTVTTFLNSSQHFSASGIFTGDVTVALTVGGPPNEITEVAFDNFVINTGTVVSSLYPQGIVAYWKFDEGNGGVAYDSVDGHHGIIQDATWAIGQVGEALSFDGINDGVTIPHSSDLDPTTQLTVDFWMKAPSDQPGGGGSLPSQPGPLVLVVDKSHGWIDSTGWAFQINIDEGYIFFSVGRGGPGAGDFPTVVAQEYILDNQWHHVAGTFDVDGMRSKICIYIDGVLSSEITELPFQIAQNTRAVNLAFSWGKGIPTRFYRGSIDELGVYNRALTFNEIQQHYQNGLRGLGYEIRVNPIAVAEPGLNDDEMLVLSGSRSYDPNGIIVSWDWSMDNRDSEGMDYVFSGEIITTEGVDIGVYDVVLTVTNNKEITDTDSTVFCVPAGLVGCPDLQVLVDNLITLLGVDNKDEIIYAIISLQNEIESLSEQITQLRGQLAAANETIRLQTGTITALEEELALRQGELNAAEERITELETALSDNLVEIEVDFQTVFNDSDFVIPGNTLLERIDSLINAVMGINKGRKMEIYKNLGGKIKRKK
jgi:hypothetical protein